MFSKNVGKFGNPTTNAEIPAGWPKAQNGLWAPFDMLECTTSADESAARDGWGPNFYMWIGPGFPGSASLSSFHSIPVLLPFRITASF
jgi:hypothetical protein